MPSFFSIEELENSSIVFLSADHKRNLAIFFIMVFMSAIILTALPLTHVDISFNQMALYDLCTSAQTSNQSYPELLILFFIQKEALSMKDPLYFV